MASAAAAGAVGAVAAGGGTAGFVAVAPAVAAVATTAMNAASAVKLVKEMRNPSPDISEQQVLQRGEPEMLQQHLKIKAKRLREKIRYMTEQRRRYDPETNEEKAAANSLQSDIDNAVFTVEQIQGIFDEQEQPGLFSWLKDNRSLIAALLPRCNEHLAKLDTYTAVGVQVTGMRCSPAGRKAACLLLCDDGELKQFHPSCCRVSHSSRCEDRIDVQAFDAVVIARPRGSSPSPSCIAQQLLEYNDGREQPLLWILLGDDTGEIREAVQLGEGDLMLHGNYKMLSFAEQLLSRFGAAVSLDPASALLAIQEDPCNLEVIASRVQHRPAPQCCQSLVMASCC